MTRPASRAEVDAMIRAFRDHERAHHGVVDSEAVAPACASDVIERWRGYLDEDPAPPPDDRRQRRIA